MNVQNNLPTTTQITFHEDTLTATEKDGKVYVAMKPVCEALGLEWSGQYRHIQRDEVLNNSIAVMAIQMPQDDQQREIIFLPLKYLNGWLFKISTRRIKNPLTRAKLIRYQEECYDVLFEYFNAKPDTTPVTDNQPDGVGHVKDRRYGKLITVLWHGEMAVFNKAALVLAGKAMIAGKMVPCGNDRVPYVGGYLAKDAIVKAMKEVLSCK
ncbi:MAG: phage antirepressor N-terminal domain-containing protein [Nitrospirae bacterium]|nr:phage antirepressor N-terminal domain-containing protein [Nitrospirota bacterium]